MDGIETIVGVLPMNNPTHHHEHLLDFDSIVERRHTKDELANHHYSDYTFDTALPQHWLDKVTRHEDDFGYEMMRFGTVWLYPPISESKAWLCGIPAALSEESHKQLTKLKIAHWTPRGYFGEGP